MSPTTQDPFVLASSPSSDSGSEQQYVGHVRNWFPFRLIADGTYDNVAHQSTFGALQPAFEYDDGVDDDGYQRSPSREEWMTGTARLVSAVQNSAHPAASLQKMDQEFSHLPMYPTKLNKELVRTRKSCAAHVAPRAL